MTRFTLKHTSVAIFGVGSEFCVMIDGFIENDLNLMSVGGYSGLYCPLGFELQKESTLTYEAEFSLAPQREKWCLKPCVHVSTARGYARHYRIVFKSSVKLRVKFTISAFHVAIVRRRS